MKPFLLLALGLVLPLAALAAQDQTSSAAIDQEKLKMIREQALVVDVVTSVSRDTEVFWASRQYRLTVLGLAVSLKLESANLLVLAQITPYRKDTNTLMLVIAGQLWLKTDDGLKYHTSVQSAETSLDKPVYFYPLGRKPAEGQEALVLEIRVRDYDETQDSQLSESKP